MHTFLPVKRMQKISDTVPDFFSPRPINRHCATAREARSVFTFLKSYAVRLSGAANLTQYSRVTLLWPIDGVIPSLKTVA